MRTPVQPTSPAYPASIIGPLRTEAGAEMRQRRAHGVQTELLPGWASGERVLTSAKKDSDDPVVASDRALYHRSHDTAWMRLGWEHLAYADWDGQHQRLVLVGLTPGTPARTTLHVPDGHALAALARDRIRWTTLLNTSVDLGNGDRAQVIVRRDLATGAPLWVVRLDDGVDRSDPELDARIDTAIRTLRAHAGL